MIEAAELAEGTAVVEQRVLVTCGSIARPRSDWRAENSGGPTSIQCWQQMFHPPGPGAEPFWRAALVQSMLLGFRTHPLDLICFLFGRRPCQATAHIPHPRADTAADVVVQVTLRFPGERLATLLLNRISRALPRYLELRVDSELASIRLSFGGIARASLDWSGRSAAPWSGWALSEAEPPAWRGPLRKRLPGACPHEWRRRGHERPAAYSEELMSSVASGTASADGSSARAAPLAGRASPYESGGRKAGRRGQLEEPGR